MYMELWWGNFLEKEHVENMRDGKCKQLVFAVLTWWRCHWWRFADCHQVVEVHQGRVLTQETMWSLLLPLFIFQWISQETHIKGVRWHCSTCTCHFYIATFIFPPTVCSNWRGTGFLFPDNFICCQKKQKTNSVALSPRANYTDWATFICCHWILKTIFNFTSDSDMTKFKTSNTH
jgi:hypothetical protein